MKEEELRQRIREIFDRTRIDYEGVYEPTAEDMLVELFNEADAEEEE